MIFIQSVLRIIKGAYESMAEKVDYENYCRETIGKYWKLIFREKFELIEGEYPVYADFGINAESNRIGSIDCKAKYNNKYYLIEEDLIEKNTQKWHWSKILAYKAAFRLDFPRYKSSDIRCAVFLSEKNFSYQLRNILSYLDIDYFFFEKYENGYRCKITSLPMVLKNGL